MVLSFIASVPDIFPATLTAIYVVIVGLAMISRMPTFSFKNIRVSRNNAPFVLLGVVLLGAALLIYPWATLAVLTGIYAVTIVLAQLRRFRKNKEE
jgi:CDP-diacylglycerol--serine O-phosphatidyltransferase